MNAASNGMMCLKVGDTKISKFEACNTSDNGQRFYVRPQSNGEFILQPSIFADECLNTDNDATISSCDFSNLPKWMINGKGRIAASSASATKCLNHDVTDNNNAKVSACSDNSAESHVSIVPFRSQTQSNAVYPLYEIGLSSIYPNNGYDHFYHNLQLNFLSIHKLHNHISLHFFFSAAFNYLGVVIMDLLKFQVRKPTWTAFSPCKEKFLTSSFLARIFYNIRLGNS